MKPFPLPVRSIGPGSQPEDEVLDCITMPQGMTTYQAPILPEPDSVVALHAARAALDEVRRALVELTQGAPGAPGAETGTRVIRLDHLDEPNRQLINQVLGEGEVSARILPRPAGGRAGVQVQESVYAGVWRVLVSPDDGPLSDHIEVGPVPQVLRDAGVEGDARRPVATAAEALRPGVMNAPAICAELDDQLARWREGQAAHVINLSLLPLSPEDLDHLAQQLGVGDVTVLSRGYGNCRVTSTQRPHCWQVVYYNSQDQVILNTIEVTRMPDVVSAAPEDLQDSLERVTEVLQWLEGAA